MKRKKVYSLRGDMSRNIPDIPFTGFDDDSKLATISRGIYCVDVSADLNSSIPSKST